MTVTGRVFICHASADVALAQAVVAGLEAAGVACWISARDVGAGRNFQEAIVQAIRDARAVVFLLSAASNRSEEVRKELALASSFAVAVLPVRLGAAEPVAALRYELATRQWIEGGAAGAGVVAALLAALPEDRGRAADAPAVQVGPALPDIPTLVVLPFHNMSGDVEQEYFVDGLVEDITTALSRSGWLLVMGRNTAFTYKGRGVDSRQVGRELGVRYVLEGSVRKAGGRVRITCQLAEAAGGAQVWAERFDGAVDDIFDLQDRITASVAGALEPALQKAEATRASAKATDSLDAYETYLRALHQFHLHRTAGNPETIRLLRYALVLDPGFGLAKAMLAFAVMQLVGEGALERDSGEAAEAIGLARSALATAPDNTTVLRLAGHAISWLVRDHDAGKAALDRALVLSPHSPQALTTSGWIANYRGEFDVARDRLERALALSPRDPEFFLIAAGLAQACASGTSAEMERGVELARQSLIARPDWSTAMNAEIYCLVRLGRIDEARGLARRFVAVHPNTTLSRSRGRFPHRAEVTEKFIALLRQAGIPE